MGMFIILTTFTCGSAESKDLISKSSARRCDSRREPTKTRRIRLVWQFHSETLRKLPGLAAFCSGFVLHAYGGAKIYNQKRCASTSRTTIVGYLATSRFCLIVPELAKEFSQSPRFI